MLHSSVFSLPKCVRIVTHVIIVCKQSQGETCHTFWMTDGKSINIFILSHQQKLTDVLVIKHTFLSRRRLVIVMKKKGRQLNDLRAGALQFDKFIFSDQ